jgi:hypothetical protein
MNKSLCSVALWIIGAIVADFLISFAISRKRCKANYAHPANCNGGRTDQNQDDPQSLVYGGEIDDPKALSETVDSNDKSENNQPPYLEKGYWISQIILAVLGIGGIAIALYTLSSLRDQAADEKVQANAVLLSQEPNVVIGARQGDYATFTHDRYNNVWVVLHVINLGQTAALHFNLNAWSIYALRNSRPDLHVETY